MPETEVPTIDLWVLGAFLVLGGAVGTAIMIVLLRGAWRRHCAERSNPQDAPERILADEEWWDGVARLVLVLTTTFVGLIFGGGLLAGNLHLTGPAGFVLAAIWLIQGGVPLYQQIHSLQSQRRFNEAIRKLRRKDSGK